MPIFDRWVLLGARELPPDIPVTSPALRSIFARRGVSTPEDFRKFIAPTVGDLHDGALISGMDFACERIRRAIDTAEEILIYGDYDVDGVTSIVLLTTVLRYLGGRVDYVVPHRLYDGYGLKMEVLDRVLAEKKVGLVITVDCGISSVEPVRMAIDRGIDVIITDHHLPPGHLPDAAAILNPKVEGCAYPFKDLAGVGVAFKVCVELLKRTQRRMSIESLLKIAAIGTIADVAPLLGENRTIALLGLSQLATSTNAGLKKLLQSAGFFGQKNPRSTDIGFRLGPRINAAGRLASADTAIRLFQAGTESEAAELVEELNRLNQERQRIEKEVLESAEALISLSPGNRAIVLWGETWHKGVLGLCASRLAQKYHRPTLLLASAEGRATGSGRSIEGVNLHAILDEASHLMDHFGGHEYACGFSLPAKNLEALRDHVEAKLATAGEELFLRRVEVDAVVDISDLTRIFFDEHELLQPFGAANRHPVFAISNAEIESFREFSAGCWEVRFRGPAGVVAGVVWPSRNDILETVRNRSAVDIVFELEGDPYQRSGFRLNLLDCACHDMSPLKERIGHRNCFEAT